MKLRQLFLLTAFPLALLLGWKGLPGKISPPGARVVSELDTNILVYDWKTKEPYRFYQYFKLLRSSKYTFFMMHYDADGARYRNAKHQLFRMEMYDHAPKQRDSMQVIEMLNNLFYSAPAKSLAGADTTLTVHSITGAPLHYYQYAKEMSTGKYTIVFEKGKRSLRLNPDSLLMDSASVINKIYYSLQRADKIVVKKSLRRMYVIRGNKTIFQFPVNLGRNPVGHKQREGDGRTPEGSYHLTGGEQWSGRAKTLDYYRGFVISYPNGTDSATAKRLGVKTGGEIMIHGTNPKKAKLKDWTNGCVAISNAHMDTLTKYKHAGMPVEILK